MASQISIQIDGGSSTATDAVVSGVIDIDTVATVDATITGFLLGGM